MDNLPAGGPPLGDRWSPKLREGGLPAEKPFEPEVIEPEIIGAQPPAPSLWQQIITRAAISLSIGLLGILLCGAGLILTITIIGAPLGIPLILAGLAAIFIALIVLFSGGNFMTIRLGKPRVRHWVLLALLGQQIFCAPDCRAAQKVFFTTQDGWKLAGLYQPPKKDKPTAVLVHGVASVKGEWDKFSSRLWKIGFGTLAIDLRGHGESTLGPGGKQKDFKDFDATGEWPRMKQDMEAALAFLAKNKISKKRAGLIGASIGANLVSQTAASNPDVSWVVLLSPGLDYRGVKIIEDLPGREIFIAA
ncbi:MAG: alpha/beta fold hydrolase [Elusimicrobia bacterium]|nr:alpha/beta fold hydrolase [Elusimicrobiota bacterium]